MDELKIKRDLQIVANTSFFTRVFSWNSVRESINNLEISFDEYIKENIQLASNFNNLEKQCNKLNTENIKIQTNLENSNKEIANLKEDLAEYKTKASEYNKSNIELSKEVENIKGEIKAERKRTEEALNNLKNSSEQLEKEKQRLKDEEKKLQEEELENRKKTWQNHEKTVEENIRRIARVYGLKYMDITPGEKNPDNMIELMPGEKYIIFDAKSPSDPTNVSNVKRYITSQVKDIEKYYKEFQGLDKTIYLVVPDYILNELDKKIHDMQGYKVMVINTSALDIIFDQVVKLTKFDTFIELGEKEKDTIIDWIFHTSRLLQQRVVGDRDNMAYGLQRLQSLEMLPENIIETLLSKTTSDLYNVSTQKNGGLLKEEELTQLVLDAPKEIKKRLK